MFVHQVINRMLLCAEPSSVVHTYRQKHSPLNTRNYFCIGQFWAEWVLDPFCPSQSLSSLTQILKLYWAVHRAVLLLVLCEQNFNPPVLTVFFVLLKIWLFSFSYTCFIYISFQNFTCHIYEFSRMLFWIVDNNQEKSLMVSNLDGSEPRKLYTQGLNRPQGITVDPRTKRWVWKHENT